MISAYDYPSVGVPWDYEQKWPENVVNPKALHYLQKINIFATFFTWVAAQTIDAPSNYWGESYGQWTFNGSGTLKKTENPPDPRIAPYSLEWHGSTPPDAAGVFVPEYWSLEVTPFSLKTNLPIANVAEEGKVFK